MKSIKVLLLFVFAASIVGAAQRPNILFCLADDWGWPHAGAYGDEVIELRGADGLVTLERFPRADQYRSQAEAVHATILDGADFACPLEFSRGNQRMIDMIYDAAG